MKGILYLSDLSYEAKGRRYCDEDILVTDYLRTRFNVALCHPSSCAAFEDVADVVVLRNMGAVAGFQDVHDAFCKRAKEKGLVTYNQLTGKADMVGKQYLLDMTDAGMPTIPTVEHISDLGRLPEADRYVIKPKDGADSNGMEFLPRTALLDGKLDEGMLIQPAIDFEYEVSFFFLDGRYEYALYAPDPLKRWELEPYEATGSGPRLRTDVHRLERYQPWDTACGCMSHAQGGPPARRAGGPQPIPIARPGGQLDAGAFPGGLRLRS